MESIGSDARILTASAPHASVVDRLANMLSGTENLLDIVRTSEVQSFMPLASRLQRVYTLVKSAQMRIADGSNLDLTALHLRLPVRQKILDCLAELLIDADEVLGIVTTRARNPGWLEPHLRKVYVELDDALQRLTD